MSEVIESANPVKIGDAERLSLYIEHWNKGWEGIKSGTENFDRSMLTISSGALALSLSFVKDVVPLGHAVWLALLFISWILFALCIVITIASFQISIANHKEYLNVLPKFFLEKKQEFFDKQTKSLSSRALDWCTRAAIGCFAIGLVCTLMFVWKNVWRNYRMSNDEIRKLEIPIDLERGLKPAGMTPIPAQQRPAPKVPAYSGNNEPAAPRQPKADSKK